MMKRNYFITGFLAILAIAAFFIAQKNAESPPETGLNAEEGIAEGKLARDFALATIDGNVVKLSDFRGKYVLFASMATWCVPCQIEAANVKRAQNNFPHIPLVVMQIDVDQRETAQDLERFRQQFGRNDWIMGFDDGSIAQLYSIRSFDTTIIVDPDGKIVYRDNGFPIDTKTLEDLIVRGESANLVLGSTHEHANISVTLGGSKVDFADSKYQLRSSFVHFEDSDGKEVHVHAKGVTLKYLFETFGWEAGECIVTDFGSYCGGTITADGQESDIEHEVLDSENIEVIYR
ncbi:TlpA family protein disulfide reductase [Candidatus Woesearchaeota archaeon]|nr:TlpA family protein disulfide reductase [Candidatus Woesearchaeota archaeon]